MKYYFANCQHEFLNILVQVSAGDMVRVRSGITMLFERSGTFGLPTFGQAVVREINNLE